MPRKLTKREKLLFIVLATVTAAVAYVYFLIIPSYREMVANRQQIATMTEKVRTEMDVAFLLAAVKADGATANKKFENSAKRFNINMTDGLFLVKFGRELEKEAAYLDAYVPGKIQDSGVYLTMPVRMLMSGDYNKVLSIIRFLESQTAMAELRTINIRVLPQQVDAAGKVTAKGQVAVDCLYIVYTVPEPKGLLLLQDMKKWTYGRKNPFYDLLPELEIPVTDVSTGTGTGVGTTGTGTGGTDPGTTDQIIPEPFLPPL